MTQIRYAGQALLNGRQRGYKQAGKRMLPRDDHDAFEITSLKLHGLKELKAARRAEVAAYEESRATWESFDPFDSALRKLRALSGRKRKLAEAVYHDDMRGLRLPRSIARVVRAMRFAHMHVLAEEAEERMLANATVR
jgi:hypothetical protein